MTFNPRNILVIDFGQLGDVVMSLPALGAIRGRFPHARLTVAVGRPGAEIIEMSGLAQATIEVDRVGLRDGFQPLSALRILQIVKDVRRREFDFVIDLHSFAETNLLGFLSKARRRLFARRPGRSLDFLANFDPKPPGAGHPGRCWPLERFVQLADFLMRNDGVRTVVFVGPEERHLVPQMRAHFPSSCVILDKLTIPQLAAAQARLAVFVSNDTGPVHIAAAVGTPIVVLIDLPMPHAYVPLAESQRLIFSQSIAQIEVEEAYGAIRELLGAGRTEKLFAG